MSSNNPRNRASRPINSRPEMPAADAKPGANIPADARSTARSAVSDQARTRRNAPPPPPTTNTLPIILAIGAITIGLVAFIVFLIMGSTKPIQPASQVGASAGDISIAADPTAQVQNFPNQGQNHFTTGQSIKTLNQTYNSNPPTSGSHWPNWSNWGVFQQPVADEMQVHNLEHGGVIIQYDCPQGCPQAISTLSSYAFRYPATNFTGVMLAPRSGGLPDGARIALTAWTQRLLLKTVDTEKINQFVAAYINKGPEKDPNFRP